MIEPPETRYAKTTDGAHMAYQVVGEGPLDVVLVPVGTNHLDLMWEVEAQARVFRRLASFSRLVLFDHRGTGMSDPLGFSEQPSLEARTKDMLAVLDAAASKETAVLANGTGGLVAMFFAATYPSRTASLVLDGCYARLARAPDYPWGVPKGVLERALAEVNDAAVGSVDRTMFLRHTAPNAMNDAEFLAQMRRYYRSAGSPAALRGESQMMVYADVRPLLSAIQAPTLVLYRRDDPWLRPPHSEFLAEQIPGSKLVELPGQDNLMVAGDSDNDLDEIEEFLTGARHAPVTDRVLATVLFTDIVASTERAAELGDRRWRDLLDTHDRTIRRQLERFRGVEVNTAGDGFIATFDGPGRAIECACAIRDAVRALGIEVRVGLHTGEIELRGRDIAGIGVHIAARVAALAGPSEVLVSSAIPTLVVGSGVDFAERGEHELKGVPGTWKLYAVAR